MIRKHITSSLQKIERAKVDGYHIEALLNKYILVTELINFISLKLNPSRHSLNVKPKENVRSLLLAANVNPSVKSVIAKKNLKSVKLWVQKMDEYIKTLRIKRPAGTGGLLGEGEKVLTLLHVSAEKLMATQNKKRKRI